MLSIAHALTGAAIATNIHNPYISIPLILASHYILDAVPHWDAGTGLGNGTKSVKLAILHEIPDLLLAGILILLFFPLPNQTPSTIYQILKLPQVWGSFIALIPDFLEVPRNFFHWEPKWLSPINRFHHSFHNSTPHMLNGLTPQFLLLIIIWLTR